MGDTETVVREGALPTLARDLGRTARFQALAAAVGAGILVGAVGLGLYGWFGTRSVPAGAEVGIFAVLASLLGGLVLAIAVGAWFTGRARTVDLWSTHHRWELGATAAVVLALVVLGAMSWSKHLPSRYTTLRAEWPYFAQLTTAVGATVSVAVGSILVLPLIFHMGVARTIGRRTSTAAVVVGLVVAAAAGVLAVRAGDDSVNVDHRTVPHTRIPATADRFGTEAFRLRLPPLNNRPEATGRAVIPAGTGFLVIGIEGLRAYDGATGEPRWHYVRRPQSGTRTLRLDRDSVFTSADGAVVTTRWSGPSGFERITTFDAVTGHLLWTSADDTDFTSDDPEQSARLVAAPAAETLIVETDSDVKGYDPRTASRRWLTPITDGDCRPTRIGTVASENAVYRLLRCGDSTWRVVAIDTGTGHVVGHRDLPRTRSHEPRLTLLHNTVLIDLWSPDHDTHLLLTEPDQLATTPIRTSGGPFAAAVDGSDILVGRFDPTTRRFHVDSTTVDNSTTTPVPTMAPSDPNNGTVQILTDEILSLEYHTSLRLSRWPRRNPASPTVLPIESTCRPEATQPTLLPAPSSILVICQNNEEIGDATLDIIGYH